MSFFQSFYIKRTVFQYFIITSICVCSVMTYYSCVFNYWYLSVLTPSRIKISNAYTYFNTWVCAHFSGTDQGIHSYIWIHISIYICIVTILPKGGSDVCIVFFLFVLYEQYFIIVSSYTFVAALLLPTSHVISIDIFLYLCLWHKHILIPSGIDL